MIHVTCGIITEGSKLLAVQRGPNKSQPMKWEFPGGKINRDETAENCIVRELTEELQVQIAVQKKLKSIEYHYSDNHIKLIPFVCKVLSGELILTEHIAKCWFNLEDWQTIDWAEADFELILKNWELLKQITTGST